MKTFADLVVRMPWLFIVLFLGITAGMATQLPNLEIDPEIKNQLPPDMPARLNVAAIEDRFGGFEMLMVVMTADDVLDPASLQRLQKISEGLEQVEGVDKVMSLFTLTDIRGSPEGLMEVSTAVEDIPGDDEEREALRERLRDNGLVYGNVVARDFTAAATIAMLSTTAEDSATIAAVEAALAEAPGPEKVVLGGMPDVRTHVSEDIRGDIRKFLPVGLAIILIFLYVCFRQLRGVILPFAVVVMSVIVAMGLIPVFGWKVQMVTVTLPVILLAVANDYGIHLLARFQEENVPGNERTQEHLARTVMMDLGVPVFAAGVTTMAGLLCLTTHIVVPAAQLGVLAAIGVGFALVCSLGFIPAVLRVLPVPPPLKSLADRGKRSPLERGLHATARLVSQRPKTIVAAVLAFAAVATSGIAFLQVDTNPVNYYDASAPVAKTSNLINEKFGGSTELAVMIEGDMQDPAVLRKVEGLEKLVADMPHVGFTSSISQLVRDMNRALQGDAKEAEVLPDTREAVAQYFLLYSMGGDPEDFQRIVDFEYQHTLLVARINSLSTSDTSAVVQQVNAYVEAHLADYNVVVGGFGSVFAELVDAVVEGQITSLALSMGLVFVLVALAFRSPVAGVYAVVPLAVAIPVLFGLMGYMGIELNVVTAMLSSIMIGVGVDYTIHFLWRYRAERAEGLAPDDAILRTLTTAGRGIVFNALSVIVGFAVLLISNFLPVQFFGFLVVVSITGCLMGALVLLPAMCLVLRPRFLEPPG